MIVLGLWAMALWVIGTSAAVLFLMAVSVVAIIQTNTLRHRPLMNVDAEATRGERVVYTTITCQRCLHRESYRTRSNPCDWCRRLHPRVEADLPDWNKVADKWICPACSEQVSA